MTWFFVGYLLVAASFYGYISATAVEEPHMGVDERGFTYTQTTTDVRKAA